MRVALEKELQVGLGNSPQARQVFVADPFPRAGFHYRHLHSAPTEWRQRCCLRGALTSSSLGHGSSTNTNSACSTHDADDASIALATGRRGRIEASLDHL